MEAQTKRLNLKQLSHIGMVRQQSETVIADARERLAREDYKISQITCRLEAIWHAECRVYYMLLIEELTRVDKTQNPDRGLEWLLGDVQQRIEYWTPMSTSDLIKRRENECLLLNLREVLEHIETIIGLGDKESQ